MRQILKSLLFALVLGHTAFAGIIDFEDLMHDDNQILELPAVYYSGAFVLTNNATEEDSGFPPSFATLGTQVYGYSGSTALFNNNYDGPTVLTALNSGWTINLYSITLAELFPVDTSFDVVFTGNRADGSIVQQTFTLDGLLGPQNFSFGSDFTQLNSVTWNQTSYFHQFDNISADAVPEPGSAYLAIGGATMLLAFAIRRRR